MPNLSEILGIATYRQADGRVLIRLVGSLDAAGASRLMDEVTQSDPGVGTVVTLHLEDVTGIDPAGIGALFYTEAFVEARGGDFAIIAPSPDATAALEVAGLDRHITARDDDTWRLDTPRCVRDRSGRSRRSRANQS